MEILTWIFWKRLLENSIHAFAGGTLGVIVAGQAGLLAGIPWWTAVQVGVIGAVVSALTTLGSQTIPNTPAGSFLPPKGK